MKQILKKLKQGIAEAKKQKDDFDEASWNYQTGILLTPNEAKVVIKALNEVNKKSSNSVLSDSLPFSAEGIEKIFKQVSDELKPKRY